ncbi:MAG: hypothetical protein HY898_24470 [Deltaproteobacteria bacterium]|nr:hypothetical protein [Deltaproteobacteria bacterium]
MKRSYHLAALASGACFALACIFSACQSSDDPSGAAGSTATGGCATYCAACGQGAATCVDSCKSTIKTSYGDKCAAKGEELFACAGKNGCNVASTACQAQIDSVTQCFMSDGGTGGSGGGGQGGSGGGPAGSGGGPGGTGGDPGDSGPCMAGQAQTVEGIATGAVGPGIAVQFTGIATTAPTLVYTSKSKGTCLWGVFVKDPAKDIGTMVVSYGANMETLADGGVGDCVPNKLFDGIVPGDSLTITGQTDAYAPSTCNDAGVTVAKQVQVKIDEKATACLTKTAGTAPAPVKVTDIDGLAQGKANYQGLLVELNNVQALDWADGGTVGPYGIIKIKGTNETLEIHDKFYYTKEGAPQYTSGVTFNKIVGIVHLDYCTWAIQPLHKCTDLDPKSSDCP